MNEHPDEATPAISNEDLWTKIIVGEETAPLAELSLVNADLSFDRTPLQLNPSSTRMLGNLIQTVPGLAAAGMQASTTTYMLRFAPDVAAQLGSGTATLMQGLNGGARAIAVNSSGQIVGHPTIVNATGLSTVMTATLLWQTLAIVTAQHYLHDMQQQLNTISSAVKDLQDWMLLKEQTLLISHEKYLQRIMKSVERGAVQELDVAAISGQLDLMERECDQVQEMMRRSMERHIAHMRHAPIAGRFWWGVRQNIYAAQEHVNDFNNAAKVFAAAVRVRGMLAAFRHQFFLQVQVSAARLQETLQDCARGRTLINSMYDIIDERRDEARATIDPFNALYHTSRDIREQSAEYRRILCKEFGTIDANLQSVRQHAGLLESGQHSLLSILIERDPDDKLCAYAVQNHSVHGESR